MRAHHRTDAAGRGLRRRPAKRRCPASRRPSRAAAAFVVDDTVAVVNPFRTPTVAGTFTLHGGHQREPVDQLERPHRSRGTPTPIRSASGAPGPAGRPSRTRSSLAPGRRSIRPGRARTPRVDTRRALRGRVRVDRRPRRRRRQRRRAPDLPPAIPAATLIAALARRAARAATRRSASQARMRRVRFDERSRDRRRHRHRRRSGPPVSSPARPTHHSRRRPELAGRRSRTTGRARRLRSRADLAGDGHDTGVPQVFAWDRYTKQFARVTDDAGGCTKRRRRASARPAHQLSLRRRRRTSRCCSANQRFRVQTDGGDTIAPRAAGRRATSCSSRRTPTCSTRAGRRRTGST